MQNQKQRAVDSRHFVSHLDGSYVDSLQPGDTVRFEVDGMVIDRQGELRTAHIYLASANEKHDETRDTKTTLANGLANSLTVMHLISALTGLGFRLVDVVDRTVVIVYELVDTQTDK